MALEQKDIGVGAHATTTKMGSKVIYGSFEVIDPKWSRYPLFTVSIYFDGFSWNLDNKNIGVGTSLYM